MLTRRTHFALDAEIAVRRQLHALRSYVSFFAWSILGVIGYRCGNIQVDI